MSQAESILRQAQDERAIVGVIGAGAWGTALAQMLASDGRDVLLWAFEPEVVAAINSEHRNPLYLPSATLAPTIRATGDPLVCVARPRWPLDADADRVRGAGVKG